MAVSMKVIDTGFSTWYTLVIDFYLYCRVTLSTMSAGNSRSRLSFAKHDACFSLSLSLSLSLSIRFLCYLLVRFPGESIAKPFPDPAIAFRRRVLCAASLFLSADVRASDALSAFPPFDSPPLASWKTDVLGDESVSRQKGNKRGPLGKVELATSGRQSTSLKNSGAIPPISLRPQQRSIDDRFKCKYKRGLHPVVENNRSVRPRCPVESAIIIAVYEIARIPQIHIP